MSQVDSRRAHNTGVKTTEPSEREPQPEERLSCRARPGRSRSLWSRIRNGTLEAQTRCKLDDAGTGRGRDLTEGRTADVSAWQTELRVVKGIEEVRADFQMRALSDISCLRQTQIHVELVGPAIFLPTGGAVSVHARRVNGVESIRVEPVVAASRTPDVLVVERLSLLRIEIGDRVYLIREGQPLVAGPGWPGIGALGTEPGENSHWGAGAESDDRIQAPTLGQPRWTAGPHLIKRQLPSSAEGDVVPQIKV